MDDTIISNPASGQKKQCAMHRFRTVTPKNPCPVCNRGDWCSQSSDGEVVLCRRQGGPDAIERRDKHGARYWIHRLGGTISRWEPPLLSPEPQVERAATDDLNRVYHAMLGRLHLEDKHRQDLYRRGLSDVEISLRNFRSLSLQSRSHITSTLINQFNADLISRVPGFVPRQDERNPYWTLSGQSGLLIPIRNSDCAIAALMVRVDDPGKGGKYRWLSSKPAGGPGPEVQCHIPLHDGDTQTVRISEGPLKSDVTTALSGILTIGLPGVGPWRLALSILESLHPATVLLAWDSDWRCNSHVARSLGDCAKHLNKYGYRVLMESWCPEQGKGIDDALLAGHQPQRKPWQSAIAAKHRGMAHRREAVRHG